MSEEKLLEQISKIILTNNERLTLSFRTEIKASEERVKQELIEKIRLSQEDTIEVLSTVMHANYDNHEIRIKRVEDELHLPPLKQN